MKKAILKLVTVCTIFFASVANAQVGVGVPAQNIHPSAELEVKSTTKGFLPPRMTKEMRDQIKTPAAGLLIYQIDGDVNNGTTSPNLSNGVSTNENTASGPGLYYYDGTAWKNVMENVTGAQGEQGSPGEQGTKGDIGDQGPAGTLPNGTASGQMMYWNGRVWVTLNPGTNGQVLTVSDGDLIWTSIEGYGKSITDIDGNVYRTVNIGSQQWMAENLKVSKYNDGKIIPNVQDNTDWSNLTTDAWSTINNDLSNNTRFGKLYNWFAVSATTNNVCPTGWHVPTDAEWDILINYLGGNEVAGSKMKQVGTSNWNSPNDISTNSSLFTALAGAARYSDGNFGAIGHDGNFWSSTENDASNSWLVYFNNSAIAGKSDQSKKWGLSVRCLKD